MSARVAAAGARCRSVSPRPKGRVRPLCSPNASSLPIGRRIKSAAAKFIALSSRRQVHSAAPKRYKFSTSFFRGLYAYCAAHTFKRQAVLSRFTLLCISYMCIVHTTQCTVNHAFQFGTVRLTSAPVQFPFLFPCERQSRNQKGKLIALSPG